jgi:hypothetical protein
MTLADANERFDLRRYQQPPFDPLAVPSPLAGVKAHLKGDLEDEVLFTVTSDVELAADVGGRGVDVDLADHARHGGSSRCVADGPEPTRNRSVARGSGRP